MLEIKTLLPVLKKLVTDLSEDLLARSTAKNDPYSAKVDAGLREAYTQIEKGGRTADAFEVWREDYLDQVAVAWVLGCVFVRFMEDNHLIDECWLAGDGERRKLAEDTHELYFRAHPHESDREYFEHVFHEVGKIPACRDLFAEGKTPLWAVGPSGDAAMKLLAFWRDVVPETGELKRSFDVEDGDTRFLGDLYQDLSERARKKYALLQTPVFVEEFILDRTLNPAIDEFSLDVVRMIDPTCGSGHFLLGGFARLFDLWMKREDNEVVAAQKALDGVWGVDINPFAVAIARFRLIVAALRACGIKRLKNAPAWNIHLAAGDSLLFGSRPSFGGQRVAIAQQLSLFDVPAIYAVEDRSSLQQILRQGYHAVVGNPPYIIVRDRVHNVAIRELYSACSGKYSLGIPFTQRFWELAVQEGESCASGFVGLITANSFMKREFGKKLIEELFPKLDLTCVIDTSGAYIPGHGTPTVILLGRGRKPLNDALRVVMGILGEPSKPDDPATGKVWSSIVTNVDVVDFEDAFVSVRDCSRHLFEKHPWSIGGGGAAELKEEIESSCTRTLGEICEAIGVNVAAGLDDAYFTSSARPLKNRPVNVLPIVAGDMIRDWCVHRPLGIVAPYDSHFQVLTGSDAAPYIQYLWPSKSQLAVRKRFGVPMIEKGATWYEWQELYRDKQQGRFSIIVAEVATHLHAALVESSLLLKNTAQVIKLQDRDDEQLHLSVVGIVNSSVSCFFLKQISHNKGDSTDENGARTTGDVAFNTYQFNGNKLKQIPLPEELPGSHGRAIHELSIRCSMLSPNGVLDSWSSSIQEGNAELLAPQLSATEAERAVICNQMIEMQESLDWHCYRLYGLLSHDLCYLESESPIVSFGERAFEIVMARKMAKGELETKWFERHGAKPITEIPHHWPEDYRKLVEQRIEQIETNKEIGLIEKPEYKRRWNTESWEDQQRRSLCNWLLDCLESDYYWPNPDQHEPRLQSIAELSDKASGDQNFRQVAAIYRGRDDFDIDSLVAELVESESVPSLPSVRYKPAGLRKREVWEKTWELQRNEDGGDKVAKIKVPPKYASSDFPKSDYWRLRGKLDIPKERWISFPHCETESDPSLVVGWAGWNHLQQATAIIAYYDARKREGWDAKRLTPLLAGLDQLLPWIHQWHPEVDPEFGETAGQSFETMLKADAHELGLTLEDIRAWEPPAKKAGSKPRKTQTTRKKATKTEAEEDNDE